ncbi:guanine deaminase [Arboricoccus pini]|uniref:Guanine deaminase n=1 Tax=Arboricoccus pini TaxID=1963835 RepID=A0A212R3Y0_9PROT|nr:guanine deaminase [Arboricoccus pini]SNB66528.1 guanine deaminase [Arboricoccus pini]
MTQPVPTPASLKAIRGPAFTFKDNPFLAKDALHYEEDALILISDGRILSFGAYAGQHSSLPPDLEIAHYPDGLISAGFIDCHVHYPQLQMIGAYGEQLLAWLERYVFPTERRFSSPTHAAEVACLFLRALLRAGTTTAAVYCTVHPQSVEAFFAESARFNTRMVAGKVLMDRHAPPELLDTVETGYAQSKALIERWHGQGRQLYAVTPRFAPSCSPAQLDVAASLLQLRQGLFMQTHLAENEAEVAWVKELFPEAKSYLDVYQRAGLVGPRAILGHAIHVGEGELCTCHATGAALAHCPTSNLFLGSGLFRLFDAIDPRRPVRVGLGTDIGAGTSLSQLQSLNEAYKVAQLTGHALSASQGFWLATRGAAEALYLQDHVGTLAAGQEADIVILDPGATALSNFRRDHCDTIDQLLFMLMTLGDDRMIKATYVNGQPVYDRDRLEPFVYPPPAGCTTARPTASSSS